MKSIIVLSGADGSGKSTIAKCVSSELSLNGVKNIVVWGALRPVILKPFILFFKRIIVKDVDKNIDYSKFTTVKSKNAKIMRRLSLPYLFVVFLDFYPQYFFKVRLPLLFGYTVICDRYYQDVIINYLVNLNNFDSKALKSLLSLGESFFAHSIFKYYIYVAPEVAFERKEDILSIDYLIERNKMYDLLPKVGGYTLVDGEIDAKSVSKQINQDFYEKNK